MKISLLVIFANWEVANGYSYYDGSDRNPRHICHPVTRSAQVKLKRYKFYKFYTIADTITQDCETICKLVKNCDCYTWTSSNGYCWFRRSTGWKMYSDTIIDSTAYSGCPSLGMKMMKGFGFDGGDLGCCGN